MSSTTTSSYMQFQIPTVGVESGPQWAQDINSCLTVIDAHDHSANNGVQISPAGILINADFSQANNNLTNIKTLRLFDQVSAIAGSSPNLGCLYRVGAELYYNDGAGNQVPITSGGSVTGSSGTITGLPSGTAGAAFSAGTFTFTSATNKYATMSNGPVLIHEPGVTSPNGITLGSPVSLASSYSLTLFTALPGSTQAVNIDSSGNMGTISYDNIGVGMTATGSNAIAASMSSTGANSVGVSMGATGANAVANTRTRTVTLNSSDPGLGGISLSNTSGTFTKVGTGLVDVTNLETMLTISGRPVQISLNPSSTSATSSITVGNNTTGAAVLTGTTSIIISSAVGAGAYAELFQIDLPWINYAGASVTNTAAAILPPGPLCTDVTAVAGVMHYKVSVSNSVANSQVVVKNLRLMIQEI